MAPFSPLPPLRAPRPPSPSPPALARAYAPIFPAPLPKSRNRFNDRPTWPLILSLMCLAAISAFALFPDARPPLSPGAYEDLFLRPADLPSPPATPRLHLHRRGPRRGPGQRQGRLGEGTGSDRMVYVREEYLPAFLTPNLALATSSAIAVPATRPTSAAMTTTSPAPSTTASRTASAQIFHDPSQARDPSAERPGMPKDAGEVQDEEPKQTESADARAPGVEST